MKALQHLPSWTLSRLRCLLWLWSGQEGRAYPFALQNKRSIEAIVDKV